MAALPKIGEEVLEREVQRIEVQGNHCGRTAQGGTSGEGVVSSQPSLLSLVGNVLQSQGN